jgi:hypothetical protein
LPRTCRPTVFVVLLASTAYAVARYIVFGDVSPEQLPLFVANKAVSLAGLALIGLSSLAREHERRKELGLTGLALTGVHVVASLGMLTPAYYAKLFGSAGRMTWQGELSMLAGAAACIPLMQLYRATPYGRLPQNQTVPGRSLIPWLGRSALLLTAAHVLVMGYTGWTDWQSWPGRLPPITLLSFLIAVAAVLAKCKISARSAGE